MQNVTLVFNRKSVHLIWNGFQKQLAFQIASTTPFRFLTTKPQYSDASISRLAANEESESPQTSTLKAAIASFDNISFNADFPQSSYSQLEQVADEEKTDQLANSSPKYWHTLNQSTLYGLIGTYARSPSLAHLATRLAHYLVSERGLKPDHDLYLKLLEAQSAPTGSVDGVIALLDDYEKSWKAQTKKPPDTLQKNSHDNYNPGQAVADMVSRATAVHPDYILREVAKQWQRQSLGVLENDYQNFGFDIVALARGAEFEKALEELEYVHKKSMETIGTDQGTCIQPWVYEVVFVLLCNVHEFEEAIKVLRMRREKHGHDNLGTLWLHLLEKAVYVADYNVIKYVWIRQVKPAFLNPNFGISSLALAIVSRKGDVQLSKDIIRHAKDKHGDLTSEHYELLIDAYINAGDIENAFSILSDMFNDRYEVNHHTTRPILSWFLKNPDVNPMSLVEYLQDLKRRHKYPPVEALNVLIEACVKQHEKWSKQAYLIYERFQLIIDRPHDPERPTPSPNSTTFHHMFQLSRRIKSMKLTLYLVEEFNQIGLERTEIYYDGLILACIQNSEDLSYAYKFYTQMIKEEGIDPMTRTVKIMYLSMVILDHPEQAIVLDKIKDMAKTEEEITLVLNQAQQLRLQSNSKEQLKLLLQDNIYDTLPSVGFDDILVYLDSTTTSVHVRRSE